MSKHSQPKLFFCFNGLIFLLFSLAQAQNYPGLTQIELTLVDSAATGYATFQSHNQKIVSNENGIFMTHIRSRNEPYTAQQWRLSRSVDNGESFQTIYEATHATNPPVLETDEQNNIYLVRPDFLDNHAYYYRFLSQNNYLNPSISKITGGSAGKYCMVYDSHQELFYYFAWGYNLWGFTPSGTVRLKRELCKAGDHAGPQYPLCYLDKNSHLHTAWTTLKHGVYMYWDIHYMVSVDSGRTWQKMDGTPLQIPIKVDDSGPSDRITLDDEFEVHSWLSNFLVKDHKIHFLYMAQFVPYRQHYVRYDIETATRDIDIFPEFKGNQIYLLGLDGFFTTKSSLENAPLYCIGNFGGHPACLASDDNGETWYDYATCEASFNVYSLGGCREITAEGYVIGTFTDYKVSPEGIDISQVHFLKIKAGLSTAEIAKVKYQPGNLYMKFDNAKGQPEFIRFQNSDSTWSEWFDFQVEKNIAFDAAPRYYQLKSRMGIESNIFEIDYSASVSGGARKFLHFDFSTQNYPNPFNS
ncbi:BNR-4 repeat-containing protein, partial [candidate division KSB1 bacterium]|nr:BNR-4 repeat-containing protein [candidate division KSB1 bacterium]